MSWRPIFPFSRRTGIGNRDGRITQRAAAGELQLKFAGSDGSSAGPCVDAGENRGARSELRNAASAGDCAGVGVRAVEIECQRAAVADGGAGGD